MIAPLLSATTPRLPLRTLVHAYEPIVGADHVELTSASAAEIKTASGRRTLEQSLQQRLGDFPGLRCVVAVGPSGENTSVVVASRPDAVHQSTLDGPFEVVARLSSSPALKSAVYPSHRFPIKPFTPNTTEITLPGRVSAQTVSLALSEGAGSNDYSQLEKLIKELPDGRVCILLNGPSAAGKSSIIRRLKEYAGERPVVPVPGDNNFLDIDDDNYPLTADGGYFFDSVKAMDIKRAKSDLVTLLQTGHAELPKYNWTDDRPGGWHKPVTAKGYREDVTIPCDLPADGIAVFDSIHSGNGEVVAALKEARVPFRVVYLDAQRAEDRLQRRMVRDEKDRSLPAHAQIRIWDQSVRRGEVENVIPSLLEMDPSQDTYLRLKFPTDLGLEKSELQRKANLFQEWGLPASDKAFAAPDSEMLPMARQEKARCEGILADPASSDADRKKAQAGLDRLRGSVHWQEI